jgi:transposase
MMGHNGPTESKLFYYNVNIDARIPQNHPLRAVKARIDFDFVFAKVAPLYGVKGNVSVPPPIILKLMFLLFYYDVPSERQLMEDLALRIDWLWFLGYDLDSPIPDHSVLSKARRRWGREAFEEFFKRIVWQCVEAGLVDGRKIFCDSSLVDANASNASVMDRARFLTYWRERYGELERRFFDWEWDATPKSVVSKTDPEASVVRKGKGKAKARYAEHRAVDGRTGVITATVTTPGRVNEAHKLGELLDEHHRHTERTTEVVVADSKYGTVENFLELHDRGVRGHIPNLGMSRKNSVQKKGIFDISEFCYDEHSDTYLCPAGERLHRLRYDKKSKTFQYGASPHTCRKCELKGRCTHNKTMGRTVRRHIRQEELDKMRDISQSAWSRRDGHIRQHLMERSYADAANNHGFKRSRWRGLAWVTVQNLMIAAVQNIRILIARGRKPSGVAQEAWHRVTGSQQLTSIVGHCWTQLTELVTNSTQLLHVPAIQHDFAAS